MLKFDVCFSRVLGIVYSPASTPVSRWGISSVEGQAGKNK